MGCGFRVVADVLIQARWLAGEIRRRQISGDATTVSESNEAAAWFHALREFIGTGELDSTAGGRGSPAGGAQPLEHLRVVDPTVASLDQAEQPEQEQA